MNHVLVVDDDASIRNLFIRLGAQYRWEVTTTALGNEALAALKARRFELVFVDVDLNGGIDGIALALKLRECTPDLCIVMMSGDHTNASRIETARLGPMLSKPFELSEIDALVKSRNLP